MLTVRMAGHTLAYFGRWRWHRATSPLPRNAAQVPTDFFGLCVANAPDPVCDDYVIARLNELGIRHARLDFTYGDREAFTERFLDRLLTDQFRVCLHLVQPREEARAMLRMSGAAERWRAFVGDMLDRYGSRVELIEIGTTCNRRKWSGYSPAAFFAAWQIAWEEARGRNLKIAGPNVTDFEPAYNAGWLGELRRAGVLPSVHTDNLFVERATEPEAFDHKIAGQRLARLFRFNLVRKAQLLQDIGAWAGVPTLMCAHVTWSLRRIARILEDVEEKQADYLARYACLAAASGALTRVYWGALIGQREGLIDDGTSEYPEIPHVTYYEQARGAIKDYRLRPAFFALRTVIRFIAGTTYVRKIKSERGLEIHEFLAPEGTRHVAWTMNGHRVLTRECYPAKILQKATFYSRAGAKLDDPPIMITESPVYIAWSGQAEISIPVVADSVKNVVFAQDGNMEYDFVTRGEFSGVCRSGCDNIIINMIAALETGKQTGAGILRDARNRVVRVPQSGAQNAIVLKMFRPQALVRRWFARRKGDKAFRSWNNANELLRRGISTPRPTAFFHQADEPLSAPSWYACVDFAGAHSARDAFSAFSAGATEFQEHAVNDWYEAIAVFLQKLHTRGVYFRDLSAGNLLARPAQSGELEFALIDTARARFYPHSLGLRLRLCDLMRICHPLDWPNRRIFVEQYLAHNGRRFSWWMKIPFWYYDWKHRVKNRWKQCKIKN